MKIGWVVGVLCVASCAPKTANAPAPAPQAQSVKVAKPTASAAPAPAETAVPRVLAVVRPDSNFVLYLDGDKLGTSPWFHTFVRVSSALRGIAPFDTAEKRCGFDPSGLFSSLAVAGRADKEGATGVIVEAELTRPASDALSCVARLRPDAKRTRVAGHDALALGGAQVLMGEGRILVLGKQADVASFNVDQAPRSLPSFAAGALSAHRDATLVAAMDASKVRGAPANSVELVMESDQRHWSLSGEFDAVSRAAARSIAYQLDFSQLPVDPKLRDAFPEFRRSIKGNHVSLELRVDGAGAAQARGIGALAATVLGGVRRYVNRAKQDEARNVLSMIAKELAISCSRFPDQKCLLPPSAPPVPATAPRGTKYQSKPSDWHHGTWAKIHFEMVSPQYYSYEIVTSKDRKSAEVRATGDLDGDGKLSHFSIRLEVQKNGEIAIAPNINEEDPDE